MNSLNYVGVSGLTHLWQVVAAKDCFLQNGFSKYSSHIGAINFQASYKSLALGGSSGNLRVPCLGDLNFLTKEASKDCLVGIHYFTTTRDSMDSYVRNSLRERGVFDFVDEIDFLFQNVDVSGIETIALQFNMNLPSHEDLESISKKYPKLDIVYQLTNKTKSDIDSQLNVLKNYDSLIDYIIIDDSLGVGKELCVQNSINTYFGIKKEFPKMKVIFAGGLKGSNVDEVINTLRNELGNNDFSIDAEGGLRDKRGKGYGNDWFNLEKMKDYIINSKSIL